MIILFLVRITCFSTISNIHQYLNALHRFHQNILINHFESFQIFYKTNFSSISILISFKLSFFFTSFIQPHSWYLFFLFKINALLSWCLKFTSFQVFFYNYEYAKYPNSQDFIPDIVYLIMCLILMIFMKSCNCSWYLIFSHYILHEIVLMALSIDFYLFLTFYLWTQSNLSFLNYMSFWFKYIIYSILIKFTLNLLSIK